MKYKEGYLKTGGIFCPFCKNRDIEGGFVEINGGTAQQTMTCGACGGAWQDGYRLEDLVSLDEPEAPRMLIETPSGKKLPVDPLLLLDVDASELFEDESRDWQYCVKHAPWQRPDQAVCEFIIYIGWEDGDQYSDDLCHRMKEFGCSVELLALIELAREKRAVWLMLHA